MDQGSNKNHSPAYNFTPTVTKFCVMWEGLSLPHDTKFGNCRCKIVDSRSFHSWSLIHGLRWSGLIKVGPGWGLHVLIRPLQSLEWRGHEHHGVSNYRRLDCLFKHLFRLTSQKASKPALLALYEGNPLATSGFHSQTASNAETASIWCRHHENLMVGS